MAPHVGLTLMLEDDFRVAAAPLFADEIVDVLEWSFDTGWTRPMPEWADALLDHYGGAGRLLGHGVHFSPLSATWEPRQDVWLTNLSQEIRRRSYVHISEHYGFMTAPPFVRGAPLPVPRSFAALAIARDRVARLREACGVQFGLENLALAWSRDEALAHGAFLDAILDAPTDFVVLDLHNLDCQVQNFGLDPDAALASFDLGRVREIHVSGGSDLPAWRAAAAPISVRCDTHDDAVPEGVFDLLARAIPRCPNLFAVVFERLGGTIGAPAAAEQLRRDFRRVREIVDHASHVRAPPASRPSGWPLVTDTAPQLAAFEAALLALLVAHDTEASLREALAGEPAVAPYAELVRTIDGRSLGIASRVVRKYARQ